MASLLSLPNEIIQEIGLTAEMPDLKSLRAVCLRTCISLDPVLFPSLTVHLNLAEFKYHRIIFPVPLIDNLAAHRTPIARYVQRLSVVVSTQRSPSVPKFDRKLQHNNSALGQLKNDLRPALASLINVVSATVRFDTHGIRTIPAWVIDEIFQGLKILPLLDDVHISQPDLNLPFLSSIKHLNGLRTFHWNGSGHCHRTLEKGLALAIAACPDLAHLELNGDSMTANDLPYISHTHSQHGYHLSRLFRYVSPDKPLLLSYLDIREWNVSHSAWLYPNLRSLQTLIIRDGCDVSPHFWNGLVKEHVRIPDLTLIVGTDPAPLHFLRSNKEMVRLVLWTALKDFGEEYEHVERMGKAFFKDVLPLLSGTLEELHIKPRMRGKWGYGDHATDSITQCKQLKVLGIHVSDYDSMASLLGIIKVLPALRTLYLYEAPTRERPWHARGSVDTDALEKFRIGDTKREDVVRNLEVILPQGVVYKPELMIDGEKPSWFFKRLQSV
ncbi:uncharacterized protein EV420DRAFT_1057759 [Desarmillaria tabescens]|uniref:Uncharacterized protein n=1 Tax=Armillaria tabescens TaxID=1929756 RepID=A0AA39NFH3_ARMTA|nr:uncharacterized protein EV420DRAFT_1057759 [Desarmillaria tabescens]KAK0464673.1 hypothetical protein EV420DRAFT_1057759 [Desarmillaria tabescens]